ncbi:MAG: DUF2934 domain-containing protein [Opitutus sp.]
MKTPTQEEVSDRAYQLWEKYGRPDGRDVEIWFEAERELADTTKASASEPAVRDRAPTSPETQSSTTAAERVASAQTEGHHPPVENAAEAAAQAAQQKKAARAPKVAVKTALKSPPPETGKPLWSQPHSS